MFRFFIKSKLKCTTLFLNLIKYRVFNHRKWFRIVFAYLGKFLILIVIDGDRKDILFR